LCCLSFAFDHCVVCLFLLTIVLSVFFFWPLCCLSSIYGFWLPLWYLQTLLPMRCMLQTY
jgi:hypothetical protein